MTYLRIIHTSFLALLILFWQIAPAYVYAQNQAPEQQNQAEFKNEHQGSAHEGLIKMITVLAIGYVGTIAVMACAGTTAPSFFAFVGGALAVLAGELLLLLTQKDASKKETQNYSQEGGQSGSFDSAAKTQKEQAKAEKLRFLFWQAAAAAFFVAAGLSLYEASVNYTLMMTCEGQGAVICGSSLGTAANCCAATVQAGVIRGTIATPGSAAACAAVQVQISALVSGGCGVCVGHGIAERTNYGCCTASGLLVAENFSHDKLLNKFLATSQIPAVLETLDNDSSWEKTLKNAQWEKRQKDIQEASSDTEAFALYQDWVNFQQGKTQSLSINEYQEAQKFNQQFKNIGYAVKKQLISSISKVGDLLFPSAQADASKLLGALGIAAGPILALWFGTKSLVGVQVLEWLGDASSRAVLFGVFGALAQYVALMAKKSADQYEKEANNLKAQGQKFKDIEAGTQIENQAATELQQVGANNVLAPPLAIDYSSIKMPDFCFAKGTNANPSGFDQNCDCKKNNSCSKINVEVKPEALSQFPNPGLIQTSANDTQKLAQQIANGNLSAAAITAEQLGKNAAGLAAGNKKMQTALNNLLQKNGQKTVDFAGQEKSLQASLLKKVGLKVDENGGLATLQGSSLGLLNQVPSPSEVTKESSSFASVNPQFGSGNQGVQAGGSSNGLSYGFEDNQSLTTQSTGDQLANSALTTGDSALNQKMAEMEGINNDESTSLWDIVSSRYQRTLRRLAP